MEEEVMDVVKRGRPAKSESAEAPDTKTEWVLNAKTDKYEKKEVPAEYIESVHERWDDFQDDQLALGSTWNDGRGKEFHARWVNREAKYHNTERQLGYAPVRKEDFNDPRFPVVKVPGVDGDVITCGDLILFEQPETIFARRRAKAVERKRREMEELRHGATEQIKEDAKRMGINMDGGLTQSIGGFGQNYHEMEANVEVEAQEELMSGRTSTQFGGFRGNPQYNKLKLSGDSRLNVAEQV